MNNIESHRLPFLSSSALGAGRHYNAHDNGLITFFTINNQYYWNNTFVPPFNTTGISGILLPPSIPFESPTLDYIPEHVHHSSYHRKESTPNPPLISKKMRIQPPSMWDDPPLNIPQGENTQPINHPHNPRAPFFSSLWRSFTATPPPAKWSVEKRKDDKTITITNTDTVTEQLTIYHNQTVYTTLTTEFFFTHNVTIFQPTTVVRNMTMTATSPLTISVPFMMTALGTSTTTSMRTSSHVQPSAAANSEVPRVEPVKQDGLSTKWILAIVFGVLGFLVLLGAVLWGVRWFLQKYRRERVERKRLQMEANEMPVMKGGKERGGEGDGDGGVFVIE